MTSSDPDRRCAEQIIARLIEQIGEENLARQIDRPIERAAEMFAYPADQPYTPERFHHTITAFIHCLYEHAPLFGRTLTDSQAHDEAVGLLSQAYRGEFAAGYEGAVIDAAYSTGSGLRLVLDRLKELVKARLRQTYKRWLILRHVDPADWQIRCAIATVLFERCRPYMPPGTQPMFTGSVCRPRPDPVGRVVCIDPVELPHRHPFAEISTPSQPPSPGKTCNMATSAQVSVLNMFEE